MAPPLLTQGRTWIQLVPLLQQAGWVAASCRVALAQFRQAPFVIWVAGLQHEQAVGQYTLVLAADLPKAQEYCALVERSSALLGCACSCCAACRVEQI